MTIRLKLKAQSSKKPPFNLLLLGVFFFGVFFHSHPVFSQPLKPEEAFSFQVQSIKTDLLEVRFRAAPGHFLYRDKFKFTPEPSEVKLGLPQFPTGQIKEDPVFGRTEIFRGESAIMIPLASFPSNGQPFTLVITFQGCADKGLCYPPKTLKINVALTRSNQPISQEKRISPPRSPSIKIEGEGEMARLFQSSSFSWIILSFFGFGLLLSFTPCVFPMVPIISGIIMAQGAGLTKRRSFLLSLTYVLGMALTYSAAGVAAGLSGRFISAALQNAWVLAAFALIFIFLALSMFGFYDIQIPSFIQSKCSMAGKGKKTGAFLGVFFMGLLSAVIIGPCVTAPLAGALLFLSRTQNIWLGGSALFSLSMGMGVPLLIIGTSAGTLLPKAGPWMKAVKVFFGVLLLAVAVWTISPLIPQVFNSSLSFQRITTLEAFDSSFKEINERPVMLFVSADWCTSCKEIELITFRDKAIKEKIINLRRLKVDVTDNRQEAQAILKKFGLFGPPALLFFDNKGKELPGTRVIGVPEKEELLKILGTKIGFKDSRGQGGKGF